MLIGGGISLQVEHLPCPKKASPPQYFFMLTPSSNAFHGLEKGLECVPRVIFMQVTLVHFTAGVHKTAQHLPGTTCRQTNRTLIHAAFSQWQHRHTSRRKTTTKKQDS